MRRDSFKEYSEVVTEWTSQIRIGRRHHLAEGLDWEGKGGNVMPCIGARSKLWASIDVWGSNRHSSWF